MRVPEDMFCTVEGDPCELAERQFQAVRDSIERSMGEFSDIGESNDLVISAVHDAKNWMELKGILMEVKNLIPDFNRMLTELKGQFPEMARFFAELQGIHIARATFHMASRTQLAKVTGESVTFDEEDAVDLGRTGVVIPKKTRHGNGNGAHLDRFLKYTEGERQRFGQHQINTPSDGITLTDLDVSEAQLEKDARQQEIKWNLEEQCAAIGVEFETMKHDPFMVRSFLHALNLVRTAVHYVRINNLDAVPVVLQGDCRRFTAVQRLLEMMKTERGRMDAGDGDAFLENLPDALNALTVRAKTQSIRLELQGRKVPPSPVPETIVRPVAKTAPVQKESGEDWKRVETRDTLDARLRPSHLIMNGQIHRLRSGRELRVLMQGSPTLLEALQQTSDTVIAKKYQKKTGWGRFWQKIKDVGSEFTRTTQNILSGELLTRADWQPEWDEITDRVYDALAGKAITQDQIVVELRKIQGA